VNAKELVLPIHGKEKMSERIGIIAIGRNEGERLRLCLASALAGNRPVVYVDSNSSDGSPDMARALGADVVTLDMSLPFSAARARNAGFDRLIQIAPDIQYVQFVDGDCQIVAGWLEQAAATLDNQPQLAVVCGRRRERCPQVSVYNRLADLEWDTPVGPAQSCGGDAMMRVSAFRQVGGYDASVVAGEEPELCQRLREKNWQVLRMGAEMTLHDSAILHVGQWWKRCVRSGYGAMDIATRFARKKDGLYVRQIRRARAWALALPVAVVLIGCIVAAVAGWRWGIVAACALAMPWPLEMLRLALKIRKRMTNMRDAMAYGLLLVISRWANVLGQYRYVRDRAGGKTLRLIEYKIAQQSTDGAPDRRLRLRGSTDAESVTDVTGSAKPQAANGKVS